MQCCRKRRRNSGNRCRRCKRNYIVKGHQNEASKRCVLIPILFHIAQMGWLQGEEQKFTQHEWRIHIILLLLRYGKPAFCTLLYAGFAFQPPIQRRILHATVKYSTVGTNKIVFCGWTQKLPYRVYGVYSNFEVRSSFSIRQRINHLDIRVVGYSVVWECISTSKFLQRAPKGALRPFSVAALLHYVSWCALEYSVVGRFIHRVF